MNYNQYTKANEYTKFFEQFNLVIFYQQRPHHEKFSEKQHSQIQTIQRTLTSKNVAQGNGNLNNFWKGSCCFCRQCLRTFFISYDQNIKMAFWKMTFVSEHLNTDQSQVTKCFYSLYGLPVAVLAIPVKSASRANQAKSAKLIVDYLFHVFILRCTHLH